MTAARHQAAPDLLSKLPRGTPFDLATLESFGISRQRVTHYTRTGELAHLAYGVYAFPNDALDVRGALRLLQSKVVGMHVGGRSALTLHKGGERSISQETLVLWGSTRFVPPTWFTVRFPTRYVFGQKLFEWVDDALASETLYLSSGRVSGLRTAVPERAILELLYEVGTRENLEEARSLFDDMEPLREDVLGRLLSCCTSVKAVRLLLSWARKTGAVNVDALLQQYPARTGSNSRWVSRFADGTLLILDPLG